MRSNYKRLGDYIRPVDIRNTQGQVTRLLGVSIEKKFISSSLCDGKQKENEWC